MPGRVESWWVVMLVAIVLLLPVRFGPVADSSVAAADVAQVEGVADFAGELAVITVPRPPPAVRIATPFLLMAPRDVRSNAPPVPPPEPLVVRGSTPYSRH